MENALGWTYYDDPWTNYFFCAVYATGLLTQLSVASYYLIQYLMWLWSNNMNPL